MIDKETFNNRLIELLGFLKGIGYERDDGYINNFCYTLREYLENNEKVVFKK